MLFNAVTFGSRVFNYSSLHFATVSASGIGSLQSLPLRLTRGVSSLPGLATWYSSAIRRIFPRPSPVAGIGLLSSRPLRWRFALTSLPAIGILSIPTSLRRRFVLASPVAVASLSGRGLVVNFWIDASRKLYPLGVLVLRQSKFDAFPEVEVFTEPIPADAEISPLFDTDLSERVIELDLVADSSTAGWLARQHELAKYLNPSSQRDLFLVFAEQSDRGYWVRVAGETYINPHPAFLRFTLPLRIVRPYAEAVFESEFTGSGTINYPGNLPTPVVVTVKGPATNPEVTIRTQSMKYLGTLATGDVLVIDTGRLTVELNGQNALSSFSGSFPWLQPGANTVTVSSGTVTIKWKNRWL